jgi:hypothetical protein
MRSSRSRTSTQSWRAAGAEIERAARVEQPGRDRGELRHVHGAPAEVAVDRAAQLVLDDERRGDAEQRERDEDRGGGRGRHARAQ